MTDALYPPSPVLDDTSFLQPSAEFKSRTVKMILGIFGFIALYLILVILSIGLLAASGALAVAILSLSVNAFTIGIALGLFCLGVMFFFFTIKFIFTSTKEEEPLQFEITRHDHPMLVEFIHKLAMEVGTKIPRKIFLTPDVNAAVLYNSSFWSMFLPVRKNLRIGLGLVNSLNISEFKATLAHEFGHFAQSSMKAGSYVYTMNKVIFNLAYQRDRYDALIEQWSATGGIFGTFAYITNLFVEGVRGILRSSYSTLNISYMALSREMEYHADLIACSAAGNDAMVNTLRKIELADMAYRQTLSDLNSIVVKQNKKTSDIYEFHRLNMSKMVEQFNAGRSAMKSRVHIKDQWASHPSREERESSINRYRIESVIMDTSAWSLFSNVEATKERMTRELYSDMANVQTMSVLSSDDIAQYIIEEADRVAISPTFRGLYDGRGIFRFDPELAAQQTQRSTFEELFSLTAAETSAKYFRDISDRDQIVMIAEKSVVVDFFEFDGVRYKANEAPSVVDKLNGEILAHEKEILERDVNVFRYYYERAKESGEGEDFMKLYKDLGSRQAELDIVAGFASRQQVMINQMNTRTKWRDDQLRDLCRRTAELEKQLKEFMGGLGAHLIAEFFPEPDKVKTYLKGNHLWNNSTIEFNSEGFGVLHMYVTATYNAVNSLLWDATKAILERQLALTPPEFVKNE
jgi:Zn-dependent protease with chaperone function